MSSLLAANSGKESVGKGASIDHDRVDYLDHSGPDMRIRRMHAYDLKKLFHDVNACRCNSESKNSIWERWTTPAIRTRILRTQHPSKNNQDERENAHRHEKAGLHRNARF